MCKTSPRRALEDLNTCEIRREHLSEKRFVPDNARDVKLANDCVTRLGDIALKPIPRFSSATGVYFDFDPAAAWPETEIMIEFSMRFPRNEMLIRAQMTSYLFFFILLLRKIYICIYIEYREREREEENETLG